jgi:hypothetical protein
MRWEHAQHNLPCSNTHGINKKIHRYFLILTKKR